MIVGFCMRHSATVVLPIRAESRALLLAFLATSFEKTYFFPPDIFKNKFSLWSARSRFVMLRAVCRHGGRRAQWCSVAAVPRAFKHSHHNRDLSPHTYEEAFTQSMNDPEAFWGEAAKRV